MKKMRNFSQWDEFKGNRWKEKISVRDFVRDNYTPYDGDESFLEEPTSFGENFRSFRKQNVQTMVFWTWRQRL